MSETMPKRQIRIRFFLQKGFFFYCVLCLFVCCLFLCFGVGFFFAFYQIIFAVVDNTPKNALGKDDWPILGLDAQHWSG